MSNNAAHGVGAVQRNPLNADEDISDIQKEPPKESEKSQKSVEKPVESIKVEMVVPKMDLILILSLILILIGLLDSLDGYSMFLCLMIVIITHFLYHKVKNYHVSTTRTTVGSNESTS